jgi:ABC-type sugar transport system ATPase subunit
MAITGLEDVTVMYGNGATALDRVSVGAGPGEILAVLGPSGSGKSTLLRAVAGLVPVTSGEVLIDGRNVTRLPVDERRVAMVFESNTVIPFLDVSENLGWGLQIRKVPSGEARKRVRTQAQGLRLSRFLGRMPKTLSSGELSRVGIGHALVHAPSAFLFDEPLAHLDAHQRWAVRRRILEVVKAHRVATIYVTHDQEEAMGIADRIALLDAGTVVQVSTPRVLYARPANVFAAGFVGSPTIGLLPARPVDSDDRGGYRVGARILPLWRSLPAELTGLVDRDVVLGIRPEQVHEAGADSDPDAVTLPATVALIEATGPDAVVTLELAAPAVSVPGSRSWETGGQGRARLRARFARDTQLRPGETVQIAVDVSRAHVFDAATGRALHHPEGPLEPSG